MKNFISIIVNSAIMTVLIFTMTSCRDSKKEIKAEKSNIFVGTWVAKQFIDNLITDNGIETTKYGVTEIIVPENEKDSITFLNEDLEKGKYLATIKNDTLISLYEKAIIKNGNLILIPLDKFYHSQEYIKVDSSTVKKAKEANLSSLRILINRTLSGKKYLTNNSKTEIKFTEDGKVKGLANFKNYHININGDEANAEDITTITFMTLDDSNKNLGIKFYKDKVELYDLILLTKSGEKPYFKKGKLLYALTAIKSK